MARSARKNAATTSTGECSTSENGVSGVGNKSGRGFTRNLKLLKIFKGQRFPITWTNRRPVGKYSKVFKSECTALVRQIQNAPLQVKEWRHVPYEKKKKLFDNVLEHFIVEGQETLVWQQMNRSYKNYRNSLKKKWFDPYGDDHEEARENLPPNIAQDDWNYLVNLWSDKDWKDMCEKNKISRSQNLIIHITGSKSFQQRKEKEKTGEELGRVQLFEVTHVRANGLAINEHTQEALMAFKNFTTQVAEGSLQMSEDEMFVEVFGPEHHGRVRGYGDGVTPTELWGSSSSSIRDLQRQLKESEEKRKENDADLQRQLKESEEKRKESDAHLKILEAQVNRVESLLALVMKKLSPPELAQSESST